MLNMLNRGSNFFLNINTTFLKRCLTQTTATTVSPPPSQPETQLVSSTTDSAAVDSNLELKSKFSQMINTEPKEAVTFARMFRHSKFVSLGDLNNKYLIGRVVDICGDDLYIDYGGKFNCVCKRPERNAK